MRVLRSTVTGAFTVVGGYWLVAMAFRMSGVETAAAPYVAAALGAAIAGGVFAAHAPVRWYREPVAAAWLATLLQVVVFFAYDQAQRMWFVERSEHPWAMAALFGVITSVFAAAGAAAKQRLQPLPARGAAPAALLSTLITMGLVAITGHFALGWPGWALFVLTCVTVYVGGCWTQLVVAERHPIAAGFGMSVITALVTLGEQRELGRDVNAGWVLGLLFAMAVIGLVGSWGAQLGWRLSARRRGGEAPDLPLATSRRA